MYRGSITREQRESNKLSLWSDGSKTILTFTSSNSHTQSEKSKTDELLGSTVAGYAGAEQKELTWAEGRARHTRRRKSQQHKFQSKSQSLTSGSSTEPDHGLRAGNPSACRCFPWGPKRRRTSSLAPGSENQAAKQAAERNGKGAWARGLKNQRAETLQSPAKLHRYGCSNTPIRIRWYDSFQK
jgi:hypothetical protein